MTNDTSWLVYKRIFPRYEEVKRTEKYITKSLSYQNFQKGFHYDTWCDEP